MKLPSVCVTYLIFFIAANVQRFGDILMLIDDEDSIEMFFDDAKFWDDSKRKDTSLELLTNKGSFPTELDRKGAAVAFRGPGNGREQRGFFG